MHVFNYDANDKKRIWKQEIEAHFHWAARKGNSFICLFRGSLNVDGQHQFQLPRPSEAQEWDTWGATQIQRAEPKEMNQETGVHPTTRPLRQEKRECHDTGGHHLLLGWHRPLQCHRTFCTSSLCK